MGISEYLLGLMDAVSCSRSPACLANAMSAEKLSARAEGRAGSTLQELQSAQIRRNWRAVVSGDLDPRSNLRSEGRGKRKGMLNWHPTWLLWDGLCSTSLVWQSSCPLYSK